MESGAYLWL